MAKTRDDLIEDVRYGRLEPLEAEAEAKRLGLQPFARSPDPETFDPLQEEWWTLVMSVAWIATRDIRAVQEQYDPYRLKCFDWHFREWRIGLDGSVHAGYFLEQQGPATLPRYSISRVFDKSNEDDLNGAEAQRQLWGALKAGQLQANGRPSAGGPRVPIPDYEWNDLVAVEQNGRDVLRDSILSPDGYDEITLRRYAVMGLWGQRQSNSILDLVSTVRPDGSGYFPLYCAAHWIATLGGTKTFNPTDAANWKPSFDDLLSRIASGLVTVTGLRDEIREKIEGHIFASIRVDYPYAVAPVELLLSEELYLSSYAYIDEPHWQKGFDDKLQSRHGRRWSKLMVLKSDVAQFWPFARSAPYAVLSGAPGRPTSMRLVAAEYQRRLDGGHAHQRVAAEARALADWLKQTHPTAPGLTPKAIENNIRAKHREASKPRN